MADAGSSKNMSTSQLLRKTASDTASYYPKETFKVLFGKTHGNGLGGIVPDLAQAAGADAVKWMTAAGFGIGGLAVMEDVMKRNYDEKGWLYDTSHGIAKMLTPVIPAMNRQQHLYETYSHLKNVSKSELASLTPDQILGDRRKHYATDAEANEEAEKVRRALLQREGNAHVIAEIIWNGVTFCNFLFGYQVGSRLQKLLAPKHKELDKLHDPASKEHAEHEAKKKPGFIRRITGEISTQTRFIFRDCFGALLGSIPDIVLSLALVKEFRDGIADLEGGINTLAKYAEQVDSMLPRNLDGSVNTAPQKLLSADTRRLLCAFVRSQDPAFHPNAAQDDGVSDAEILLGLKGFFEKKQADLASFKTAAQQLPDGKPDHAFVQALRETLEPIDRLKNTILGRHGSPVRGYDDVSADERRTTLGVVGCERQAILDHQGNPAESDRHHANEQFFRHMGKTMGDITGDIGRMQAGLSIKGNKYLHGFAGGAGTAFNGLLGKEGLLGRASGGKYGVSKELAQSWGQYGTIASIAFAPFNVVRSTWYRVFDRMFPASPEQAREFAEKTPGQHAGAILRENIAHTISVTLGCILPMAIGAVGMTRSMKTGRFGDALADVYTEGKVRTQGPGDIMGHGVNLFGNVLKKLGVTERGQEIVGYREGQFIPYLPPRDALQGLFSALVDKAAAGFAR